MDLFSIPTHELVDEREAPYHTYHPSRLMGLFDMSNSDSLVDLLHGLGVPKRKILISVPASGYEFKLQSQRENTPRSPTVTEWPSIINRRDVRLTFVIIGLYMAIKKLKL